MVEVPDWKLAMPCMESREAGDDVPIPIRPALFTMKCVAVDEPMTNVSTPASAPIESRANGDDVPIPSSPALESHRNCPATPALPKRTVDEAKSPAYAPIGSVEVPATVSPKFVAKVKSEPPPAPVPQATPVFDIVPFAENVAHPAVPPADETMRFVVDAVPETVMAVDDA